MESFEMFFQSSRGIRLRTVFVIAAWSSLILWLGTSALGQAPDTVLASVNGAVITLKQVDDSVAPQIYPLQQQLYAVRKAALENLVTSTILESEATARGISIEEVRRQLTSGEINVTRAQVEAAYTQNASFFASMSPDEARERLRLDLENQARMKHYRAGLEALRKKWTATLSFAAPAFVSELDDGISPAKGSTKPVVTIVEFSDFECPYCREVQTTLKQVMQSYGKDVRLIFKHLPLEGHRNSLPAARAAYCAAEQDRFWQFHDALFASGNLSPPGFDEIASELGLGMPKFRACLNSEQSRTAIVKDIETARLFRIESTPSFIVNGRLVKGALSFADFQKIIERELSQRSGQTQSSAN
jgi:predicted DsbA family dithiol-disulfide isomerase